MRFGSATTRNDTARAEATLRADAVWQDVYGQTFSRVDDETLAEPLAVLRML
jgi:hypothetical protein